MRWCVAVEIERKFLVIGDAWKSVIGNSITQGYLARSESHSVRVRLRDARGFLTIKSHTTGITRKEFEYEIPHTDARQLLDLCEGALVHKVRHVLVVDGTRWEIDEFLEENVGLVVAEVELRSEDEVFVRPQWLGEEVTFDPKYQNSNLVLHPYSAWALLQAPRPRGAHAQ
jgi:adenylate cyclase